MSTITDNIIEISNAISSSYDICQELGAKLPTEQKLKNLPATISQLKQKDFDIWYERKITDIDLHNCTKIKAYMFDGQSMLSNITGTNNIIHIGHAAFHDCTALSSVDILLSNVIIVDAQAFAGCTALTSIQYGRNLSNFININEGTIILGNNAIPSECAAFAGCTSLSLIDMSNIPKFISIPGTVSPYVFKDIGTVSVHVSAELSNIYKNDSVWKQHITGNEQLSDNVFIFQIKGN